MRRISKRVTIKKKKGCAQSPEAGAYTKGFYGREHTAETRERMRASHQENWRKIKKALEHFEAAEA